MRENEFEESVWVLVDVAGDGLRASEPFGCLLEKTLREETRQPVVSQVSQADEPLGLPLLQRPIERGQKQVHIGSQADRHFDPRHPVIGQFGKHRGVGRIPSMR